MSKQKVAAFLTLGSLLLVFGTFFFNKKEVQQPVFKEEIPVLKMTHSKQQAKVVAIKPFLIEATKAMEYYDGSNHEVDSITKFEGVYRSNQGIDYTYQNQSFDVIASLDGVVSEVKEDPIFGKSVTIKSNQIEITYQSLNDVKVQLNQEVKQKSVIGSAGESIYHRDLGNHLHYVVSVDGKIIDPENIFGKSVEEIGK